jgi:Limiting CO2-inducible proteins B/C beta carbonyic anhydrases
VVTLEAFPGAIGAEEYVKRTVEALAPHGLDAERTLALAALCRDELTVELTRRISETWGYPFRLGSLAAMLLTGKSGLAAALAHAPKIEGRQRVVVYAMPHVGIREDGTLGSVNRPGQEGQAGATTACGALVRFRTELADGDLRVDLDQYDVEMSLTRQRLVRELRYGVVPDIVELTTIARDVILDDLLHIGELVPGWAEADVAVFSGIQIHTGAGDHIQPGRSFLRRGGENEEIPLNL